MFVRQKHDEMNSNEIVFGNCSALGKDVIVNDAWLLCAIVDRLKDEPRVFLCMVPPEMYVCM